MRCTFAVVLLCALALSAPQLLLQFPVDVNEATRASQEVARKALPTFSKSITEADFRIMGFESVRQARAAALGEPIVSFYVRLDELLKYNSDTDPVGLLRGGDLVVYPVVADNQPRCLMELTRGPKGWSASGFGGAARARLLHWARTRELPEPVPPRSGFVEIRVLAPRMHFLAFRTKAELTVIPLLDDPRGRWRAGAALPGRKVFAALVTDAKEYRTLTR